MAGDALQQKVTDVKQSNLTEVLSRLLTNNDELIIGINAVNEKISSLGRPMKKVEFKHEEGTSFVEAFSKEVDLNIALANELDKSYSALSSLL
jgi:hypothetical protein